MRKHEPEQGVTGVGRQFRGDCLPLGETPATRYAEPIPEYHSNASGTTMPSTGTNAITLLILNASSDLRVAHLSVKEPENRDPPARHQGQQQWRTGAAEHQPAAVNDNRRPVRFSASPMHDHFFRI